MSDTCWSGIDDGPTREIERLRAEIERLHAIIQNACLALGHDSSPLLDEPTGKAG